MADEPDDERPPDEGRGEAPGGDDAFSGDAPDDDALSDDAPDDDESTDSGAEPAPSGDEAESDDARPTDDEGMAGETDDGTPEDAPSDATDNRDGATDNGPTDDTDDAPSDATDDGTRNATADGDDTPDVPDFTAIEGDPEEGEVDAGPGRVDPEAEPDVTDDAPVADAENAVSEADGGYADPNAAGSGAVDEDAYLPDEVDDDGIFGSGPTYDKEQPLAEHVEEMIRRLAVVILVAGVVSVLLFPFGDSLITVIWYGVLPAGTTAQPHIYAPLELLVTQFKVASIAGLVVALPVLVYETYAFMRPGLYPHERRYYLAAIPTSLVLAVVGIVFAYFVVVPAVMTYFLFYSTGIANAALALGSTFNLILILMAYLAIVFQIPLFVMLAIMMGLTSRRWLADRRLLFWGAFAGLSFIATPDPTGVAPVVVAATMIVLFEGTLLLLRWTDRGPAAA